MKKSYLLSLPLAAILVIPAAAQQNSGGSADQQQPQSTQAQPPVQAGDQQAPTADQPSATGKQPLKYERNEGFWGKVNPFARKKYTQRQLDPIRGRLNELDELTAKNSKTISDVDSRATEGIRQATSKVNEADTHAVDAGNRADQAQQTAQQATTHVNNVEQTIGKLDQYQPVTQAEIRFRPGQVDLSKPAKDALDEMAVSLKNQRGYVVEIQGFSAGRGATAIENSRKMADSVVRYLVLNHDVPVYRVYTVGMGNAPVQTEDGKNVRMRGGRVEISLLKNNLGDLAPGGAASPAGSGAVAPAPQENPGGATEKPSPAKPPVR